MVYLRSVARYMRFMPYIFFEERRKLPMNNFKKFVAVLWAL